MMKPLPLAAFFVILYQSTLVHPQEWGACPDWPSTETYVAECRGFIAPLDWGQPDGRIIDLFLARFRNRIDDGTNHDQLWLLNGGPGGRLDEFYFLGDLFAEFSDEVYPARPIDMYMIEHRGVGYSSSLNCSQFDEVNPEPCLQEIRAQLGQDGLSHFNTLNAGHDVAYLIDELRPDFGNQPKVFVYGVSYGTIWLDRYLHVAPTQADAVIMDGLAFKADIAQYDYILNEVGRDFMALCNQDDFCGQQFLGRSPSRVLSEVVSEVRSNSLPCMEWIPSLNLPHLTQSLGLVTMINEARPLIPAVTKRLFRCNEDDRLILNRLFTPNITKKFVDRIPIPFPLGLSRAEKYSRTNKNENVEVLGTNIIVNEIMGVQTQGIVPTIEELEAFANEEALFEVNAAVPAVTTFLNWDLYEPPLYQIPAKIEIPLLKLNGDLDPQTGLSEAALSSSVYPGSMIIFPRQVHGIALNSATSVSPWPCGLEVIMKFLLTEGNEIDLSCLEFLLPVDFAAETLETQLIALELMGTTDIWGHD